MTGKSLNDMIIELVENKNKLKEMGENANKMAISNVEDKIFKELYERKSNGR